LSDSPLGVSGERITEHAAGCLIAWLGTSGTVAIGFAIFVTLRLEPAPAFLGALIVFGLPALFVAAVLVAVAMLLVGLPVTWLFARQGWERRWTYAGVGFVAGSAAAAGWLHGERGDVAAMVLAGGLPGALCGTLWWRFARRGRHPPKG
jgi:hypothetical protein